MTPPSSSFASAMGSSFNTASGMRSHVTSRSRTSEYPSSWFQYRKRYEVTCDAKEKAPENISLSGFNTASGMRSHVTMEETTLKQNKMRFQYRKRYEVTCD